MFAREDVTVTVDRSGPAHVTGVARCGSPWACPVCGPVIREQRAADVDQAVSTWLAEGHGAWFVTLTVPHPLQVLPDGRRAPIPLRRTLSAVVDGWRHVQTLRPWRHLADRMGLRGQIKAVEVTFGAAGAHPHIHMVVFAERKCTASALRELRRELVQQWGDEVAARGLGQINPRHGVDVRPIRSARDQALGAYLTKVQGGWGAGLELVRADVKSKSRSPWAVLERFIETGDADELATWHAYEHATKGRNAITWSRGLKRRLLTADRADLELASLDAADPAGSVTIPRKTWNELMWSCRWVLLLDDLESVAAFAAPQGGQQRAGP